MVKLSIDGREFEAEEGSTVLEVIRANGIKIPTLCYHPALKPSGICRLCVVEVSGRTRGPTTMRSCILKVRDGLTIKTQGDSVTRARTSAFQKLLQMAPESKVIRNLADAHGIDLGPPPDGCIRCRLCIRVCKEIVGPGALKMEKRDGKSYVVPVGGMCIGCGTCVNICPTGAIQLRDEEGTRTVSIRDEIIGIHALERCEGCGRLFATEKFLKHVAVRTNEHSGLKEEHMYCTTCHKLFSDRIKSFARLKRF